MAERDFPIDPGAEMQLASGGGGQRNAEDIFEKPAVLFLIPYHAGVVVQTLRRAAQKIPRGVRKHGTAKAPGCIPPMRIGLLCKNFAGCKSTDK